MTKNPLKPEQPAGTDFFCQAHRCWMTYRACVSRQKLMRSRVGKGDSQTSVMTQAQYYTHPDACIDCEPGRRIESGYKPEAEKPVQKKSRLSVKRPREKPLTKPDGRGRPATPHGEHCIWPECDRDVISMGMCSKHYQRFHHGTLIACDFGSYSKAEKVSIIKDAILAAEKAGVSIGELLTAALGEALIRAGVRGRG